MAAAVMTRPGRAQRGRAIAVALGTALALGGSPQAAHGQGGAVRWSAQAALGRADAGYTLAVAGATSLAGYLLVLRWSETSSSLLEGGATYREVAGLVGYAFRAGPLELHVAAGVGRVVCEMAAECGDGSTGDGGAWRRTLGSVPLQAQVVVPMLGPLRLGVQGFGNLNAARSYGGAALVLQLGGFR